jgi:serine phosphatase RsbU (regulator of sigma subunit)
VTFQLPPLASATAVACLLAAGIAPAQADVLPPVTVTTPAVPPVTVSVPTPQPVSVTTPDVPSVAVTTPAVTLPPASVTPDPAGGDHTPAPTSSADRPVPPAAAATQPARRTGAGTRPPRRTHHAGTRRAAARGSSPTRAAAEGTSTLEAPAATPPERPVRAHETLPRVTRLIESLPRALLLALEALVAIAALMSIDAYLLSRRAKLLRVEGEALRDDVGVLQAALLPDVPHELEGLAVSVGYRPAQGLAAGGDFYDVMALSDGRIGIILGDVAGHGRDSVIQAALVRYTLRTLLGEGHGLGEVLRRADHYLAPELEPNFATVIVAAYDPASCELSYAKAGHEPPLITGVDTSGEEAAPPLGLALGDEWPEFRRRLEPGQVACFYTDGLQEARKNGTLLGRDHLAELIGTAPDAAALVESVWQDADVIADDMAAVTIQPLPAASATARFSAAGLGTRPGSPA